MLSCLTSAAMIAASTANAIECGDVLGPRGQFELDTDLVCDATPTRPAITLLAGAQLDMKNRAITCLDSDEGTYGVRLEQQRAVVRNGRVVNCDVGVHVTGMGRHLVTGMHVSVGNSDSIAVESDSNVITDNVVTEGDWAFVMFGDRNFVARNRSVRSNGDGFVVIGDRNRLLDNVAIFSVCSNFLVAGGGNHLLRNVGAGNLLATCSALEIAVEGTANRIERSVITGGAASGILVRGDSNRFFRNTSTANAAAGVQLTTVASGNSVRFNVVFENGTFDLQDDSPDCDENSWRNNRFETKNADCIH